MAVLMRHPFPGNVRELENILEFAAILCPSGFIQWSTCPSSFSRRATPWTRTPPAPRP